jgi:YD repeat-containing protein
MAKQKIKENLVFRKELVLKDTTAEHLEEREYLLSKTCYDENGNLISETQYDSSENIMQETVYTYNEKGRLVEEILRDSEGFDVEHKSFELDESGKIIREFRHYMDEPYDTIEYVYDGDLIIKKESIDFDGEAENTEEFVYRDGLLIENILKDQDSEIISLKQWVYDEKKNIIELKEIDFSQGVETRTEYEYYDSGNKKAVLVFDVADELIERTLITENEKGQIIRVVEENTRKKNTTNMVYDDKGNVVYQEEFDRNGELISKIKREYNEDNMIVESEVYVNGMGRGLSRNYTLRQEYTFH